MMDLCVVTVVECVCVCVCVGFVCLFVPDLVIFIFWKFKLTRARFGLTVSVESIPHHRTHYRIHHFINTFFVAEFSMVNFVNSLLCLVCVLVCFGTLIVLQTCNCFGWGTARKGSSHIRRRSPWIMHQTLMIGWSVVRQVKGWWQQLDAVEGGGVGTLR